MQVFLKISLSTKVTVKLSTIVTVKQVLAIVTLKILPLTSVNHIHTNNINARVFVKIPLGNCQCETVKLLAIVTENILAIVAVNL